MRLVLTFPFPARSLTGVVAVLFLLLSVHSLARAGTVQPLPAVTEADGRLGLCDVLPGGPSPGTTWAQLAANAGARINRWELRWDRIQRLPSTWNFSSDDEAVQASLDAGLGVEGILIGTPGWATAHGQRPGNGVPRGLSLRYTDPGNLWASYVRAVALHYRGEVRTWEVWNEPDLSFFWTGSSEDYYLLTKVAYQVIKGVDPTATVLIGGMVAPDLRFVARVIADAAQDASSGTGAFDGLAWHVYGRAALTYVNIRRLRALLSAHGFGDLPIWVTEDGFPSSNPNGEPRQAAYVLQTIAYALAAGASRVLIYRESDDPGPKTWGLLSAGGQPRMGYLALQVAARYFAHVQAVTYEPGSSTERFALYRAGQRVTAFWNKAVAAQTLAVTAGAPTATLVDWQGNATQINASNGQFHLVLPGASYNAGIDPPGSVVGAPPKLLIEDNVAPATLPPTAFISSLAGTRRHLVLFNQNAADAIVQVASASNAKQRAVFHLPGGALQTVDLDLLAGPGYTGSYAVSAPPGMSYGAASDRTLATGSSPAPVWYAAAASAQLTISNPAAVAVHADVDLFAPSGKLTRHAPLTVGAHTTMRWPLPRTQRGSAVVHASAPVVVAGTTAPTSRPDSTWYLVHPGVKNVALFNPNPATAQVDVRFVGSDTVTGQQLRLDAHHSYSISTHGAKAVVVASTRAIAVGRAQSETGILPTSASPSTATAVTAAGPATRVTVFNPSNQPAHISYTLVSRTQSVQRELALPVSRLSTFVVRGPSDAARGVVVRSDVPVVAVPAR